MSNAKREKTRLELGTEMDVKNALIEWHIHRFHRLVQRERCTSMIQTTRLVHHVLIKSRRDPVRRTIVHRPHRPDHRTETNKLHRRRKMDRLVWTVLVSDSRMTRREICKFGILQIAPDDVLYCKVSIGESEGGLEWLILIWKTVTRKVDPFVLAKLLNDPRSARFLSIYTCECGEAVDTLTNVIQFRAYRKEFALARNFGLTDGNEKFLLSYNVRWMAASGTNEGGQGWDVGRDVEIREILLALPVRTSSVQGQHRELVGGTPPDA